jgi:hypothetical protein
MNPVSERIVRKFKQHDGSVCEKCTADAAAIERLVQAAEAIHDHNGECPCVYADDKWNELNAALAAFREVENA